MYKLTVSRDEVNSIAWHTDRGYFPTELWDYLNWNLPDDFDATDRQYTVEIPEHIVWSLSELHEEDPDAFLTCMGGAILDKLLQLYNSIV